MRTPDLRALLAGCLLLGLLGWAPAKVQARPTYFDTLTSFYGISPGDNLNACGVCHFKWQGTGARNPYGNAVEQHLYLGKSILQSIQDVEGGDSDGDSFSNLAEIVTFQTLPGYACDNFFEALGAPLDYHTYITPMVDSCLEPLDIRVAPGQIGFITDLGDVDSRALTIFNNGSDFPLSISSYELLPGSHTAFSLVGPTAPFDIPVGENVVVDVVFAPDAAAFASGTVRISSNDPNEPEIDVPLSGLAVIDPVASAAERAECLRDVDKQYRRYGKKHLREWERCYLAEVTGAACDTGRRDLKLQQAEEKLRAAIGGSKDRRCAANGLSPSLLGFPDSCGGSCGHISLANLGDLADCLVCRQEEGMQAALASSLGTAPPDLPPNVVSGQAVRCQEKLVGALGKGIKKLQKQLGRCELENITAASPLDCSTDQASFISKVQDKVNATLVKCKDTSALLGCLFEADPNAPPDPNCLGDAALEISSELVDAAFGLQ